MEMEYRQMKRASMALGMIALLAVTGCKKEEQEEEIAPIPVTSGMVVGCEGTFNMNNGSVHWIGDDGTSRTTAYESANGVSPGDLLQSYREFNGNGFLVMNNSQKVEVVNAINFGYLGTISGLDYPRDILAVSSQKAYVTNGSGAGDVKIINLSTYSISGSIEVGNGPEEIVSNGN
jgi:DNA-binding beta-propeller fold protein YncE